MSATDTDSRSIVNEHGYRSFRVGGFSFDRDEHFARIDWPTGSHVMSVETFLKALMRDVSWNFFYGIVNFDAVIGTMNHYGNVDLFAGRYNSAYRKAELDHQENFAHDELMAVFREILADWTNAGYDPFAAPQETGTPFGPKRGENLGAITRTRVTAERMVGVPGDEKIRTDDSGFPTNRMFADVDQSEPEIHAAARIRGGGRRVQPVRVPVAQRRHLEPIGRVGVQGQPLLPDDRGVHPADHPRQRSCRVVRAALRRDHLEGRGPRDRVGPIDRGDEGRRRRRDARRHPSPGLLVEAFDAAGVGERLGRASSVDRVRAGAERSCFVLRPV